MAEEPIAVVTIIIGHFNELFLGFSKNRLKHLNLRLNDNNSMDYLCRRLPVGCFLTCRRLQRSYHYCYCFISQILLSRNWQNIFKNAYENLSEPSVSSDWFFCPTSNTAKQLILPRNSQSLIKTIKDSFYFDRLFSLLMRTSRLWPQTFLRGNLIWEAGGEFSYIYLHVVRALLELLSSWNENIKS